MRIDHVQIAMPSGAENEARAFYQGVLGMDEVAKPEALRSRGGCWFVHGSCHVHLGVDPDFRPARKAHAAFLVEVLDDLAEALQKVGYSVTWSTDLAGIDRFYSEDPFGNRLEFIRSRQGLTES